MGKVLQASATREEKDFSPISAVLILASMTDHPCLGTTDLHQDSVYMLVLSKKRPFLFGQLSVSHLPLSVSQHHTSKNKTVWPTLYFVPKFHCYRNIILLLYKYMYPP